MITVLAESLRNASSSTACWNSIDNRLIGPVGSEPPYDHALKHIKHL